MVVVPCFNEERRLNSNAFRAFLSENSGVHLLFVNDGSTDATASVLNKLAAGFEDTASVVSYERNRGKAEAVRVGVEHAAAVMHADVVGYWDADLATPLRSILNFVEVLTGRPDIQMVFGSRVKLLGRHVERRPARHYLGRVFATFASSVLRLPIYDTQCGAKLFRVSSGVEAIFRKPFLSRWIFDVEILARYIRLAGSPVALQRVIYEYPLEYWSDVGGSKVRPLDFVTATFDLLRIKRTYSL